MFRLFGNTATTVLVGGAIAFLAPLAEAGYTAVKQPKRRSEVSHEQIMERVYGGDFVSNSTGLSFSNQSGITVTRLEDGPGPATDEAWSGKTVSARAVAAFSGKRRTARYFGATSGGQVQKLLDASGRQFDVAGTAQSATPVEGDLVFSKGRGRRAKTFSSVGTANQDGMDHLVTYEVKGSAQQASVYLLCWEDKLARRSDRDYNDLVVEIQAAEAASRAALSRPLLIPLPPAAWTGLSGLLGLGILAIARKRPVLRRPTVA